MIAPVATGNTICADLKLKGLRPVWMEATDDRIAIGFEIISKKPNWTKAFHCDAAAADPPAFVLLMNSWKAQVRRDIAIGMASPVVQTQIRAHGLPCVMTALKDS